jgi:hypothetical protein
MRERLGYRLQASEQKTTPQNGKVERISFPAKDGHHPFHTLTRLGELTGYNPNYLKQLLLDGKVSGIKVELDEEPGFWVATVDAVRQYELNVKKPTGRPKNGNGKMI